MRPDRVLTAGHLVREAARIEVLVEGGTEPPASTTSASVLAEVRGLRRPC